MRKNGYRFVLFEIICLITLVIILNCSTGIVPSPDPGILKVTLQADPADTLIVVTGDTLRTVEGDSFNVKIYQGKAFIKDTTFAVLYKHTSEYYEVEHNYNLLRRENNIYSEYTIFESFLPPDNYSKIRLGITANLMVLTRGYAYGGIGIPMAIPPGKSPFIELPINFTIEQNRITDINLDIKPLHSVIRNKDIFHFVPNIEVKSVSNPY